MNKNAPNHILTAEQFNQDKLLEHLIERAEHYSPVQLAPGNRERFVGDQAGKLLFNIFYEPSTRTSFSFRTAATNLGMTVLGTEAAGQFSSAAKGETLEDTARMLAGNQPDVIVLRHSEDGASDKMASLSGMVPIINAGDGRNEHPTQALLDVYTIQKEFGRRDDLRIVIGGDIAGGRTAKSLLKLLGVHKTNSFGLVAPEGNNASENMRKTLETMSAEVDYSDEFTPETLRDADIVYWTRTQTERGSGQQDKNFILRRDDLKYMNAEGIVMHPLPRLSELSTDIDDDPRARYFQQAANGLPIRMALLDWVLKNKPMETYFIESGLSAEDKITVPAHLKSFGRTDGEMYEKMRAKVIKEYAKRLGRKINPNDPKDQLSFTYWKQGDDGLIE